METPKVPLPRTTTPRSRVYPIEIGAAATLWALVMAPLASKPIRTEASLAGFHPLIPGMREVDEKRAKREMAPSAVIAGEDDG